VQESKAGLAVGKLRQNASKDVADAAKELVKLWKGEVEKAKLAGGTNGKSGASQPTYLKFITRCVLYSQQDACCRLQTLNANGFHANYRQNRRKDSQKRRR